MENALEEMKFILYHTENENVSVNAIIKNETIWLTQQAMAQFWDVDRPSITKYLNNIFRKEELEEQVVCKKNAHTAKHSFMEEKAQN